MNVTRIQLVSNKIANFAYRRLSTKSMITLTDDGTTVVCWHPAKQFPYEYTKPYAVKQDISVSESVLKIDSIVAGLNRFRQATGSKGPILEELQTITYTPKHKWRFNRNDGIQWRPAHPRKGV